MTASESPLAVPEGLLQKEQKKIYGESLLQLFLFFALPVVFIGSCNHRRVSNR